MGKAGTGWRTTIDRLDRHGRVAVVVGLAVLLGGFDLAVLCMQGPNSDDLHTLLGRGITIMANHFLLPPMQGHAGADRNALVASMFTGATAIQALLFSLLAWRRVRTNVRRSAAAGRIMLVAQVLLALIGNSGLLVAATVELALVLPPWRGLAWVVAEMLASAAIRLSMAAIAGYVQGSRMYVAMLYLGMEVLMHVIIFAVVQLALHERRMRRDLAAAHAELLGTQALMGDMVRGAERLRIARDLHDSVGHHLTALKLHLDLAVRQSAPTVSAALHTSSALATSLLADVRTVVSAERSVHPVDLHHALATLCAGIPHPRVVLTMDAACSIASPALAHALFCCAQEAISNAVRHAHAATLTIAIAQQGDVLTLDARDDGRGSADTGEGNGLRGMRERVEGLGGWMQAGTRQRRGFAIAVTLPMTGGAP